jgi:hypothetical protein
MVGVFISKGMTISIPAGGLKIALDNDGKITGQLTPHVRFDVGPTWVQLARRHLDDAKANKDLRIAAWAGADENLKSESLEREFETSMQAIMAAAIAVDAFYALIRPHVDLPPGVADKWRAGRTARYSQVTEVLRRAFHLKTKGVANLRQNLKEIYRLRDLAVHPSGKMEAPIMHRELGVGVEWRFEYFRADNAELIVNAASRILWNSRMRESPTIARFRNTSMGCDRDSPKFFRVVFQHIDLYGLAHPSLVSALETVMDHEAVHPWFRTDTIHQVPVHAFRQRFAAAFWITVAVKL